MALAIEQPTTAPRSAKKRLQLRQLAQRWLPWLIPIVLIGVWQLSASLGWLSARVLPAPSTILQTSWDLLLHHNLLGDIAISTRRALVGLAIGGSLGFIFGLLNGTFPLSERLFDSSFQMIRNIPHLALLPLVILWFGIGETARLFLVAFGVFFPLYLNTYHGVRSIDPKLREMGIVYGLSKWGLFRHIIFPGALPSILVGLRYALGVMWLTLIVAESLASNAGIGHLTMNAREFMQTDVLVMGIVIYALLGKLADIIARLIERRSLRWQVGT